MKSSLRLFLLVFLCFIKNGSQKCLTGNGRGNAILTNKKAFPKSFLLFLSISVFLGNLLCFGEGTKTVSPTSTNCTALVSALAIPSGSYLNCPSDNRIYFNIKDYTKEKLYYGFHWVTYNASNLNSTVYMKIYAPNGTVVSTVKLPTSGDGFISNYSSAAIGPKIGGVNSSGYNPLSFTPSSNGEYWMEVYQSDDNGNSVGNTYVASPFFDITVATNSGTIYDGRVHCDKWGFVAMDPSTFSVSGAYSSAPMLYPYSDDGVVYEVQFQSGFQPIAFNVAFNEYGAQNTGNWLIDRKSINSSVAPSLPNGYKVFLNKPDKNIYTYASLPPVPTFASPAIIGCYPGPYTLRFNVSQSGDCVILLDLNGIAGFQVNSEDRMIELAKCEAGLNTYVWDGKDGKGNVVAAGNNLSVSLVFRKGRANFPIYDAEINKNGFSISSIAPVTENLTLYWDDSGLTNVGSDIANGANNITGAGFANIITGQSSPAHAWSGNGNSSMSIPAPSVINGTTNNEPFQYQADDFGNVRVINTWFYGINLTAFSSTKVACIPITGKVWDDSNKSAAGTFSNINSVGEVGANATLYAILVDPVTDKVIATTPVAADGTYTLPGCPLNGDSMPLILSATAGVVGSDAPTPSLPNGWENTTPLSRLVSTAFAGLSGIDFGIQQTPVAMNDTFSGNEDNVMNGNILTNDIDPDGITKSVLDYTIQGITYGPGSLVNISGKGEIIINANGSLTFTPVSNFNGALPVITYTMQDLAGTTSSSQINITITAVNDLPVATDDSGSVIEDGTLTVTAHNGVLKNDTDVDGDILNVTGIRTGTESGSGVSGTSGTKLTGVYGDLIIYANGSYSYVANSAAAQALKAGQIALDYFTYTVNDGTGTDQAQLTIAITGANDSPVATDDTNNATEDILLTVKAANGVLVNDIDVDGTNIQVTSIKTGAKDESGSTGTIGQPLDGVYGTLTLNTDGSYTYIANLNAAEALKQGETAKEAFTYTVTDDSGASIQAQIIITITGVSTAPYTYDDYAVTDEDLPVNIDVTANDIDFSIDKTTVDLDPSTPSVQTTYIVPGEGTYTVDHNGMVTFTPTEGFSGNTAPVAYTVKDNEGLVSLPAFIHITVTELNEPPIVADFSKNGYMDENITFSKSDFEDKYTDTDGVLMLGVQIISMPANGVLKLNGINVTAGLEISANDLANLTFTPALGWTGATSYQWKASDGLSYSSNTATVSISIVDSSADIVVSDIHKSGIEDVDISFVSTDFSNNYLHTTGLSLQKIKIITLPDNGVLKLNGTAVTVFQEIDNSDIPNLTFTPNENWNGAAGFDWNASDGHAYSPNPAKVFIDISPVADAPVAINDSRFVTAGDGLTNLQSTGLLSNDIDVDGDALTVIGIRTKSETSTTGISGTVGSALIGTYGTLTLNADGSFTYNADQPAAKSLPSGANGIDAFTYTIEDPTGLKDVAELSITVFGKNDPPVAVNDQNTVYANQTLTTTLSNGGILINDTDVDGNALTVTAARRGILTDTGLPIPIGVSWTTNTFGIFTLNTDGTYVYEANQPGSIALKAGETTLRYFTYTISDGLGGTAQAELHITIIGVNDVPVAFDDTYTMQEDGSSIQLTPISNDIDVDGDILTISSINGVVLTPGTAQSISITEGTINITSDGTVTFQPASNYHGFVNIPYTISDGNGGTASAYENITINQENDAPTALDDDYSMQEDGAVITLTPLTGDIDVDGDILTVTQINGVAITSGTAQSIPITEGTIHVASDGTITFQPAGNYYGSIKIPYTISDGNGGTASANENIIVNSVNDAPVAVNDQYTAYENQSATISANLGFLKNDSDTDGSTLTVIAIRTGTLSGTGNPIPVGSPWTDNSFGTVTVNTDGSIAYESDQSGSLNLKVGETAVRYFTYTISDGLGGTAQAEVVVTIIGVNDYPVAVDDNYTMQEDGVAITLIPLVNDTDADGDVLTITQIGEISLSPGIEQSIAVTRGTITISASGVISFVPEANYAGTIIFPYSIVDGNGGTGLAHIQITVDPVNDFPLTVNDNVTTNEDTPVTGSVSSNDTPSGDGGSVWSVVTPPMNGTLTMAASGDYTYTPNANWNGTETITYKVCDIDGDCSNATLTITVVSVDDQPVAFNDVTSTNEDNPVSGSVSSNDTTSGDGGSIWSLVTLPANGTLTLTPTGNYTYTPNVNWNGTETITYKVCDGDGDCSDATLIITVIPVDDQPVAVNDNISTNEDTPISGSISSNDTPSGDGGSIWSVVTPPSNGTLTMTARGEYTYTPNSNWSGTEAITYQVCDADGDCSNATLIITVIPVNDSPIAVNDVNATFINKPVSGGVLINDSDPDHDILTVNTTPVVNPAHGTVLINPDGTYTYTPAANYIGSDTFIYQVCDNGMPVLCSQATVMVNITDSDPVKNNPPVAISDSYQGIINFIITGNVISNDWDPDGNLDANSIVMAGPSPENGSLTLNTNGSFSFVPDNGFTGLISFGYQVCDLGIPVICSTATVTIIIGPKDISGNTTFAVDDSYKVQAGSNISNNVLNNDYDSEGNNQTVNITPVMLPSHGSVTLSADGSFIYTPVSSYYGPDQFVYEVCDNGNPQACDRATVYLLVFPVTDLSVTKIVTTLTPEVGQNIIFTIRASNNGPSEATGVKVTDVLPSGYKLINSSVSKGTWENPVWDIGSIAPASSATLTITAKVAASGNYINTATITGNENDKNQTNNSSAIIVTPVSVCDLKVVKTINNDTPEVGSNVVFTIVASNAGPSTATGVIVRDIIPSGYTYLNGNTSTGNWTLPDWNIGTIPFGGSATLTLTAKVNANGDYTNTAEIKGNERDFQLINNVSSVTPQNVPVSDLSVVKTASSLTPEIGSKVTFSIVVTNDGPSLATGVKVTDVLQSGFTFVNASGSTGTYDSSTGIWTIGNLGVKGSATLTVTANVNPTGNYLNVAEVKGDESDPTTTNNTSAISLTPIVVTDLQIIKTVNNSKPEVGSEVTFTIVATNKGSGTATGVIVKDQLTSGYSLISGNTDYGSWSSPEWNIGNLASGKTTTLTIRAKVNATGDYSNSAIISCNEKDTDKNNNTSTVITVPILLSDLDITKTVSNPEPQVGETIDFLIQVRNQGPASSTGVMVTDVLPSGYTYVSSIPDQGNYDPKTGKWSVGSLENGSSVVLTVKVKVNVSGDHVNIATVTGNMPDPSTGNNQAQATINEICSILIPEIFTPNGDGIQDYFKIRCIDRYPDATFEIFNRWGNLIYHQEHYGNTDFWGINAWWNGTCNQKGMIGKFGSEKLPSGTYYYIMNLNDGTKGKAGSIFLKR